MSLSKFESLNEYCKLDILKYVPIQDKVRFERVNKAMKRTTDSGLAAQKVLQFVEEPKSGAMIEHSFCGIVSHHVCAIDSFLCDWSGRRSELYPDWKLKVLKKMPNLRVLILDSAMRSFEHQELGNLLSSMSQIEHLEGFVDAIKKVASNNLKCVVVLSRGNLPALRMRGYKVKSISLRQESPTTEISKFSGHGHQLKVMDMEGSVQKIFPPQMVADQTCVLRNRVLNNRPSMWQLCDLLTKSRFVLKSFTGHCGASDVMFFQMLFRTCQKLEVLRLPTANAASIVTLFATLKNAPNLRTLVVPHLSHGPAVKCSCAKAQYSMPQNYCKDEYNKRLIRSVISYAKVHPERRVTFKLVYTPSLLSEISSKPFDLPANLQIKAPLLCICLKEFAVQNTKKHFMI